MTDKKFKIFIDFDGTVTINDVGESIFRKFLDEKNVNRIVEDLLTDKISARECWEQLCDAVSGIDSTLLDEFIMLQKVDATLHNFIEFCDENNLPVFILSDGFDYYIERILKREKLNHLNYFSNKLDFDGTGKLIPSFPYYNSECRSSAVCKRNHIIENSGEDEYTVFIGDGNSDNDAIQYVDFIFAKDDLLKFCEINRITYFPFDNFNDVKSKLNELLSKKRLKKRHQAQLKRREAFLIEY